MMKTTPLNESTNQSLSEAHSSIRREQMPTGTLLMRCAFGGMLMGWANLVPGISGGTMLLAAGIYPFFIESVADVTRFRFRWRSLAVLSCVVLAAGLGILLFAGLLKDLVVNSRWAMYSLFIGLTLGGLPVVWKLAKPASRSLVVAAVASFMAMVVLAVLQAQGVVGKGADSHWLLFLAGLIGASAMILPGLSGGYLLLLMGQYVPILSAIDDFKHALAARDFAAALSPALSVLLPVGLGVIAGVAVIGNLLQWLLWRYRKATLGVLLGLLMGSIVGLWPFQVVVPPTIGSQIKGQLVTAESIDSIDKEDWPTEFARPTWGQVAGSLALIGIGFGLTTGVSRIGGSDEAI